MASRPGGPNAEARYPAGPIVRSLVTLAALAAFTASACTASGVPAPGQEPGAPSPSPTPALGSALRTPLAEAPRLRLVTIGGSFTYGRGVARRDSWPQQFVRVLGALVPIELTANLAEVGRTSQDVIDEQVERVAAYRPDVVTLQIGANDVLRADITLEDYRANVATILDSLLVELPAERLFVVTTPDYTLTERGGAWADRESRSAAVAEANVIIGDEASSRGIGIIDISPISGRVTEDTSLVSPNGLHPSEKQYAGWVELIAPAVRSALAEGQP